ncbi:MAG: SDR family NAD(P)-dependent oxidoreductase [Patulibacter minatonensis]
MAQPSTVLITGAASGIGRALAHRYASGARRLLLLDRNEPQATADELAASGAAVGTASADVRDAEAVASAVAELAAGDPIDLVVNCAGVLPPIDPVGAVAPSDFKFTIDVNLTGSFNVVHAALPHLRAGSAVALVASMGGLVAGYRYTAYSASKFGVVGLAETIRMELRQQGISTHVICPGEVSTPMVDAEIAAGDAVQREVKMLSGKPITPEQAAAGIAKGIAAGEFLVIPTAQARWLSRIVRVAPVPVRHAITDLSIRRATRHA